MSYVISAYTVVLLTLALYALHLRLRTRRLREQAGGGVRGAVDKAP